MRIGLIGAGRIGAFHAATLDGLPEVSEIVLTDPDQHRAQSVANDLNHAAEVVPTVDTLVSSGLDAVVIASSTDVHATQIKQTIRAGIPTFCEKPISQDLQASLEIVRQVADSGVQVQLGFQRRFDPGYIAAREAIASGRTGWIHTVRANTFDPAPPAAEYIPRSGGIFNDCSIHDFDIIRWVTGREVAQVYALGSNRGAGFFKDADDVDTGAAILRLDDDALATVSATRYNAAGYDARLEVFGSKESVSVGLDEQTPLRSTEDGVAWPAGQAYDGFMQRFHTAYVSELAGFIAVAQGRTVSPCTGMDAVEALYIALACDLSRKEQRPVDLEEVRR